MKKVGLPLARAISVVANPLLVALPLLLVVSLATGDLFHALLWWGITVVGVSVIPLLFIWWGVRRGIYSDHLLSKREQRTVPLLVGIGCFVAVFIILLFLHASSDLLATMVAMIIALGLAAVITRFWKISLHMVGMAGAVTVLVLLFGPLALVLAPLVLLVGWARWMVRAHTLLQAFAGTVLAVGVTVGVFWLFR